MADGDDALAHLLVRDRVESHDFSRRGRGDPKIRDVEHRTHGQRILSEADFAFAEQETNRLLFHEEELNSLGVIITIEGASNFPLKLESLEQWSTHRIDPRPKWLLLSVLPSTTELPERAQVWVSDEYRSTFLNRFEKYVTENYGTSDKPKNRALVANIERIRATVLDDLWQSASAPHTRGLHWWEIWLRPDSDAVRLAEMFVDSLGLRLLNRSLRLDNRHIVWVQARWEDLHALTHSAVPVTEIRLPAFADTYEDLPESDQREYAVDLASRVIHANSDAPAVCLLDTGVRRSHILIEPSLALSDVHTVVGPPAGDLQGHGTKMAGLSLFGPLDDLLSGTQTERLLHRLESVKLLSDSESSDDDPSSYGVITAEAVALPTIEASRRRVFSMPITALADQPGEPSLWSATVDALAVGTDVGRTNGAIELLGAPSDAAKRLILVSAGNVNPPYDSDYLAKCDTSPIEDPAQAWNALSVGASTQLIDTPDDPSYAGWHALAESGDISPHTRTGLAAGGSQWPIKPDICMEGGNVLTDGSGDFDSNHPVSSVRTTTYDDDASIGSANATSAATAQASRLAARAMATYPAYWPETIRGLLTHTAEWTPAMRAAVFAETRKKKRRQLLRRFGWGVPDDLGVRFSTQTAVRMVIQDSFVPFSGAGYKMRHFRLHQLPWPARELAALGEADVELRVTLSYFIEPSASRRGWRRRYAYASHGLRFELRRPNETTSEFVRRVNHEAAREEDGTSTGSHGSDNWVVGSDQRNKGSLHQDIWMGHGAELATTGVIAVHAVGGWWKNNKRKDRQELPVRYALLVSLQSPVQDVDLYTPIAASIGVPVTTATAV